MSSRYMQSARRTALFLPTFFMQPLNHACWKAATDFVYAIVMQTIVEEVAFILLD